MYGFNNYMPPVRQEIIHVNGENGARAMQMAPNSNMLLLDDTDPLVWLAQTDGAGYKTVTPFEIRPYEPAPPVDVQTLMERIEKLEERLNEQSDHAAHAEQATGQRTEHNAAFKNRQSERNIQSANVK